MSAPIASSSRSPLSALVRRPQPSPLLPTQVRYASQRSGNRALANPASSAIPLSKRDARYDSAASLRRPHMQTNEHYNADLAAILRSLEGTQAAITLHKVKAVRIRYVHSAPATTAAAHMRQPVQLKYRPGRTGQLDFVQQILPALIWRNPEVEFDVEGVAVADIAHATEIGAQRKAEEARKARKKAEEARKAEEKTTELPEASQEGQTEAKQGGEAGVAAAKATDAGKEGTLTNKQKRELKKAAAAPFLTEKAASDASGFKVTWLDGTTSDIPFSLQSKAKGILHGLMAVVDPLWRPLEAPTSKPALGIAAPKPASNSNGRNAEGSAIEAS